MPAHPKVLGDVADSRPFDFRARVMPAETCARRVCVRVIAIARFGGEVDPADKGHAIVDDDRLLVVTVHRPFLWIQSALGPSAPDELVAHVPHISSRWTEEWEWRTGPGENPHVDTFCELGKQIAKHNLLTLAYECEIRREVPPRQMNVRTRLPQFLGDDRQSLTAIDEDID